MDGIYCICDQARENRFYLQNPLYQRIHTATLLFPQSKQLYRLAKSKCNPYLSSKLWNSVNDSIGKSKSHQNGISNNISLGAVNEFFCNVAISTDHKTAD